MLDRFKHPDRPLRSVLKIYFDRSVSHSNRKALSPLLNSRAMQSALVEVSEEKSGWFSKATSLVRTNDPTKIEWLATATSTILLILCFPDFNLSLLAWVAL